MAASAWQLPKYAKCMGCATTEALGWFLCAHCAAGDRDSSTYPFVCSACIGQFRSRHRPGHLPIGLPHHLPREHLDFMQRCCLRNTPKIRAATTPCTLCEHARSRQFECSACPFSICLPCQYERGGLKRCPGDPQDGVAEHFLLLADRSSDVVQRMPYAQLSHPPEASSSYDAMDNEDDASRAEALTNISATSYGTHSFVACGQDELRQAPEGYSTTLRTSPAVSKALSAMEKSPYTAKGVDSGSSTAAPVDHASNPYSESLNIIGGSVQSCSAYSDSLAPDSDTHNPYGDSIASQGEQASAARSAVVDNEVSWNDLFQSLLDITPTSPEEKAQKWKRVIKLTLAFQEAALPIGKRIILERNLPPAARTIPSIDAGGHAGGEKYLCNGIFFKFAVDMEGLYGGEALAQKAASLELKGQRSYWRFLYETGESRLRIPLFSLIDFAGFRLIATSLLPIDRSTLKYGSADAGRTVHKDIPELSEIMEAAAKHIGMKPHSVGFTHPVELAGPCDIEAHLGRDGRYYVLDTARLYSPETPSKTFLALHIEPSAEQDTDEGPWRSSVSDLVSEIEIEVKRWKETASEALGDFVEIGCDCGSALVAAKQTGRVNATASSLCKREIRGSVLIIPEGFHGKRLYNLLRPELLHSLSFPLSSDCFTGFGRHNWQKHHAEARKATRTLVEDIIPSFVKKLDNSLLSVFHSYELTAAMHEHGINMRYLGLMRSVSEEDSVKSLLAVEMLTRAAKSIIKKAMRSCEGEGQLKEVVALYMNRLLGLVDDSGLFWRSTLRLTMMEKYSSYTSDDGFYQEDLRLTVPLLRVVKTLQAQLGVEFSERTDSIIRVIDVRDSFNRDLRFDGALAPLESTDIKGFTARTKQVLRNTDFFAMMNLHFTTSIEVEQPDAFKKREAELDRGLAMLVDVFGERSRQVAALAVQGLFELLRILEHEGTSHDEAHWDSLFVRAESVLNVCVAPPMEVCVGANFIRAVRLHRARKYLAARDAYFLCLSVLNDLAGGIPMYNYGERFVALVRKASPTIGELEADRLVQETMFPFIVGDEDVVHEHWSDAARQQRLSHPFLLVVLDRFAQLLYEHDMASTFLMGNIAASFRRLWQCSKLPRPPADVKRLFGHRAPLALTMSAWVAQSDSCLADDLEAHDLSDEELSGGMASWLAQVSFFVDIARVCDGPSVTPSLNFTAPGELERFGRSDSHIGLNKLDFLLPHHHQLTGLVMADNESRTGMTLSICPLHSYLDDDSFWGRSCETVPWPSDEYLEKHTLWSTSIPPNEDAFAFTVDVSGFKSGWYMVYAGRCMMSCPFRVRTRDLPTAFHYHAHCVTRSLGPILGLPLPDEIVIAEAAMTKSQDQASVVGVSTSGQVIVAGNDDEYLGNATSTPEKQWTVLKTLIGQNATRVARPFDGNGAMVLTQAGAVYSWGENVNGQCGHGKRMPQKVPRSIQAFEGLVVRRVSCSESFAAALLSTGELYVWGRADYVGVDSSDDLLHPTLHPLLQSERFRAVSCGSGHFCAVSVDGFVYDSIGRRDGPLVQKVRPVMEHFMVDAAAGNGFTLMLSEEGRVFSHGDAAKGASGNREFSETREYSRHGPIEAFTEIDALAPTPHARVCRIGASNEVSVALRDDGVLFTWGFYWAMPRPVRGLDGIPVTSFSVYSYNVVAVHDPTAKLEPLGVDDRGRKRRIQKEEVPMEIVVLASYPGAIPTESKMGNVPTYALGTEVKFKWSRPTNKVTSECDQVFLYEVDDPDYTPCCVELPSGCNSGELSIEGPPNAGLYGLGIRGYQSVDGEEEEVVLYRGAPFMCTPCGPYKIKIKLLKPTVELQESVSLSYEIPREVSVESVSFEVRMVMLGDDDQVGATFRFHGYDDTPRKGVLDDTGPYVAGKYVMTAEDEEHTMDMFEVIGTRVLTAKAPELETTQEDGRSGSITLSKTVVKFGESLKVSWNFATDVSEADMIGLFHICDTENVYMMATVMTPKKKGSGKITIPYLSGQFLLKWKHMHPETYHDYGYVVSSEVLTVVSTGPMYNATEQMMKDTARTMGVVFPPEDDAGVVNPADADAAALMASAMAQFSAHSASTQSMTTQSAEGADSDNSWDVCEWLRALKLGQYAEKFVEEGFDDKEVVAAITKEELTEIGVDKSGHRKKILMNAKKLK